MFFKDFFWSTAYNSSSFH